MFVTMIPTLTFITTAQAKLSEAMTIILHYYTTFIYLLFLIYLHAFLHWDRMDSIFHQVSIIQWNRQQLSMKLFLCLLLSCSVDFRLSTSFEGWADGILMFFHNSTRYVLPRVFNPIWETGCLNTDKTLTSSFSTWKALDAAFVTSFLKWSIDKREYVFSNFPLCLIGKKALYHLLGTTKLLLYI